MPFRKRPFEPQQHLRILRLSILGVCLFIFAFSMIFQQSEYIFLFFAITGAIFTGGSGAVIIGGLYWKRGTTSAAWSSLITGSVIAVGGIILHQINPEFPINGQMFWGLAMLLSSVVYMAVSLASRRPAFDMDRLLHRGPYAVAEDLQAVQEVPQRGWRLLGMGREFTRGDKFIYGIAYAWTFAWVIVFVIGSVYNLTSDVSDRAWLDFWRTFVLINLLVSVVVIVWFAIGGVRDLRDMLHRLRTRVRDHGDSGFVDVAEPKREDHVALAPKPDPVTD